MISYIDSIIYGLIQGVTEFLPVSSSGHLALLPHVLSIKDPGVFFDLAMHLGTALAVMIYFRSDLLKMMTSLFNFLIFKKDSSFAYFSLNLIFATVISFFTVLILKSSSEAYGRQTFLIGFNLMLFGVLMFVADYFSPKDDTDYLSKLNLKFAFFIGLFQAFAIFPGVSRSGSTLTISRFLKIGREEASRFSFILSLPIIIGGFVFQARSILLMGDHALANFEWGVFIVGIITSFFAGLLTIHFFLKLIKKLGLAFFAIYRFILGLIVIYLSA